MKAKKPSRYEVIAGKPFYTPEVEKPICASLVCNKIASGTVVHTSYFPRDFTAEMCVEEIARFKFVANCLNGPLPRGFRYWLLLDLRVLEEDRNEELRKARVRRTPQNFRADFGRMDIGMRQGWGKD